MLVGILWLWPTMSTRCYRFSWEGRPSRRASMPFRMMSSYNVEHVLEREGLWFLLELVFVGVLFLICGRWGTTWPWVSGGARCVAWEIAVAFRPHMSTAAEKWSWLLVMCSTWKVLHHIWSRILPCNFTFVSSLLGCFSVDCKYIECPFVLQIHIRALVMWFHVLSSVMCLGVGIEVIFMEHTVLSFPVHT